MARRTSQWFLCLQTTLYLLLIFVRANEDAEDTYKNGRNLVLEYFLPINLPGAVDAPFRREKRDAEEGSGEDETVFSEINEKKLEDADNSTQNAFARFLLQGENGKPVATDSEGSGEIDEVSESSEMSSEEENDATAVPRLAGGELLTGREEIVETTKTPENRSEVATEILTSTEMIFDKSEDFEQVSTIKSEETTTEASETTSTTADNRETTTVESGTEQTTTEVVEEHEQHEPIIPVALESTTVKPETTTLLQETTTVLPAESVTVISHVETAKDEVETTTPVAETTTVPPVVETTPIAETTIVPPVVETTTLSEKTTTTESPTVIPVVIPQAKLPEEPVKTGINITTTATTTTTPRPTAETTKSPTAGVPKSTGGLPVTSVPLTTPEPVVEEVFHETKVGKSLEALPGNILQKENLSLAADPLLIANTRLMDSEENVQLSSSEPKRLGAYIVIGLILLSFSSLVGYITFRKRMNRKRQEFESNQESHDTEKALLSLSDYKDNSELEENHLKNNEITPIVVKSNSQINKFEKNTNFSSPKNLNTIANEKNIEKDNVLKSTAENLTQVIIEDSPKDVEEDKNVPNLEKLIVKTRIDQDSIPKKPIIINRSSAGYLPIPQDNS